MKLLVGYGNTMRRDDGVGWLIASQLAPVYAGSDVRIITVHQLLPEIAYEVARAERVVFVDASIKGDAGTVRVCDLQQINHLEDAHALTPPGILHLASYLYGHIPPAHLVTITGESFALGDTLSHAVTKAIPSATDAIHQILNNDPPRNTRP